MTSKCENLQTRRYQRPRNIFYPSNNIYSGRCLVTSSKQPEACFLNKSKFVPSSCLARDPRAHAQLENKAGFFKHSKLKILGSWPFAILELSMNLCSESWSPDQGQQISFLNISKFEHCSFPGFEKSLKTRFEKFVLSSCLGRAQLENND